MAIPTTPNMNLLLPVIGVDTGLTWEQSINSNSNTMDQHNHTPGFGTQITPAGLNINTDLPFDSNNATLLRSVRWVSQLAPLSGASDIGCAYVSGVDLWFNDLNGNQIQMTSGGVVLATSSGISSGSASASFVGGVLVVNSAASTPANTQVASILLGNNVSGSKYLTLSPPSAMASNYSLTLPTLPAMTNIVTLDTSGNFAASLNVDNSTIVISSNQITVANQGITAVQIANATITGTQIAAATIAGSNIENTTISQQLMVIRTIGSFVSAGGFAVSSSCGSFSTTSGSPVAVTNLSVSLTTFGNPVEIKVKPDGSGSTSIFGVSGAGSGGGGSTELLANYEITRNGTPISSGSVIIANFPTTTTFASFVPPSSISHTDTPSAGTYTYALLISAQGSNISGSVTASINNAVLTAYEIK